MGLLILTSLHARKPLGLFRSRLSWSTLGLIVPLLLSALLSQDLARGWGEWTSLWPLLFLFFAAAITRDAARPHYFLFSLLLSTTVSCFPTLAYVWRDLQQFGELRHTLHPHTNIWLYTLAVCSGCFAALYAYLRSPSLQARLLTGALLLIHLIAAYGTRRRMLLLVTVSMLLLCAGALATQRLGRARWPLLAGCALVLLAIPAALDPRLLHLLDFSMLAETERSRTEMWKFGLDLYAQHPLFGVGSGDLRALLHAHADRIEAQLQAEVGLLPNGKPIPVNLHHSHCHSNLIHTMAVAGSFGLLGLVQWLGMLAVTLFGFRRSHPHAFYLGLSAWALFFFGGLTDASLFSSSRLAAFTLLFGYAWGLGLRPAPTGQAQSKHAALN